MAVNLQKGQSIPVASNKEARNLSEYGDRFCLGVDWGGVVDRGQKILRVIRGAERAVNLDYNCLIIYPDEPFDHLYSPEYNLQALEKIGFPPGKLASRDGALRHGADFGTDDLEVDEWLNKEVITFDLKRVNPKVEQIFFFLNNLGPEDLVSLRFVSAELYEGTLTQNNRSIAVLKTTFDEGDKGHRSLILAKLFKKNGEWHLMAIGESTGDSNFVETIFNITKNYV